MGDEVPSHLFSESPEGKNKFESALFLGELKNETVERLGESPLLLPYCKEI